MNTPRTSLLSCVCASALALLGCGGGDDSSPVDAGISVIDSATGSPDAAQVACTVSTDNFGDLAALTGQGAINVGMDAASPNDDFIAFEAILEQGEPADALIVQLYAGYGVFANGPIAAGTYQLTGEELDFATCGVCVLLLTDATSTGFGDTYMVTGGTVTVTAVATAVGQTVSGTLSNLQLHHVNIDESTGATTQAPDTCTSSITNATFDAMVVAAGG